MVTTAGEAAVSGISQVDTIGLGVITVISRCIGVGEIEQAAYYTKRLVMASYLCTAAMGTSLFFSAGFLVALFNLSLEAKAIAVEILRL
ncbi:hypothetical protein G8C92_23760 [Paenibacillus donghaensis]|uniref:hypothetical protein n=1 Tax=Paenibacillus donghaensis TaxID=414771 RepID=UPI0018834EAB|nr:hypothetical protein [Paenibacillus donghaensis]MBE9917041.1 hypothetical protein [Paenibacillus donghaensis]